MAANPRAASGRLRVARKLIDEVSNDAAGLCRRRRPAAPAAPRPRAARGAAPAARLRPGTPRTARRPSTAPGAGPESRDGLVVGLLRRAEALSSNRCSTG